MESGTFSLDDYDGIGFDLDCTLAEYNVRKLIKLIYNLLADFLIQKKSYNSEFLLKSFEEGEYFLQKGLIMDLKRGNVLKVDENCEILKATHGTVCLSDEKIVEEYGAEKTLGFFKKVLKDPSFLMNSSLENLFRASLDCFDMACVLLFARIVDHLDNKNGEISTEYNIWPDILAGLYHLYNKNHFATGEGEFFSALKTNPSLYYKKWTPVRLAWLKEVKSKKFVFLLTGSFIDFAQLTASYCIGENWKDYFDVILCYAKKPFFFFSDNMFLNVENSKEIGPVKEEDLQVNSVYSQGNWEKLKVLISKQTQVKEPKCLYMGDNLILDVYSPVFFNCCHSLAISLELMDEFKSSPLWGSYFGEAGSKNTSFWNHLIQKYARICVSGLDVFLNKPLNFQYHSLRKTEVNELSKTNGYYAL